MVAAYWCVSILTTVMVLTLELLVLVVVFSAGIVVRTVLAYVSIVSAFYTGAFELLPESYQDYIFLF